MASTDEPTDAMPTELQRLWEVYTHTQARLRTLETVLTAVRPHLLYDTPDTYEALRQAVRAADAHAKGSGNANP